MKKKKMRLKKRQHIARLVIHEANKLSFHRACELGAWLRKQADDLELDSYNYAPVFTAMFFKFREK